LTSIAALCDMMRHIYYYRTSQSCHGLTKISENVPSVPGLLSHFFSEDVAADIPRDHRRKITQFRLSSLSAFIGRVAQAFSVVSIPHKKRGCPILCGEARGWFLSFAAKGGIRYLCPSHRE
jgi:hypothetical protein